MSLLSFTPTVLAELSELSRRRADAVERLRNLIAHEHMISQAKVEFTAKAQANPSTLQIDAQARGGTSLALKLFEATTSHYREEIDLVDDRLAVHGIALEVDAVA